ncbi:MAG: ATP-grasp domain-containing protein [Paludibacteraceae bacterium]|nr:ATP-grasp domain-containing protein [Paludibacteraceae bacterium]
MKKTIAIIGAGYLQRPLVEKAKQMGLRTICFAWAEGAVCKDICNRFYPISIVEKEEILAICREEQIAGICTIASDVAAPTVAYIANAMGLSGNSYESALRANNKYLMRQALAQAGVPCPGYIMVDGECTKGEGANGRRDECTKGEGLQLPLIVKPSDRSGSMAVTKVTDWADLEEAVRRAQEASFKHEAMVEEFIDGREISVEMISCHGTHYALQITDKVTTEAPHFVELAHHQPSNLPADTQAHIFDLTRRALDALGLTCGASHSEYKITSEGRIAVMEIGGRMGGDFIGSDLVRLSTGYDFLQGVIEVALGQTIHPQPQAIAHSGVFFLSAETPQVKEYIDHTNKYPEIVAAEQTDHELHHLTCSGDRSGYFIYRDNKRFEIGEQKHV